MSTPESTSEKYAKKRGPKARSCIVCRTRRVACDRQSPCSNCRKANIECLVAANDRAPRWAKKFQPTGKAQEPTDILVAKLRKHVQSLEKTIGELKVQLGQTEARPDQAQDYASGLDKSPADQAQQQLGRLVLQDNTGSRYVSTDFWTHINDDLSDMKRDLADNVDFDIDTSDDDFGWDHADRAAPIETSPTRGSLLLTHVLNGELIDLSEFLPLPSQIPFLLDVFAENVNPIALVVHMPIIRSVVRERRMGNSSSLTPADEALLLAIYFAAVASMDQEDAKTNFGVSREQLMHQYQSGLELALVKADCLGNPSITLAQALSVYLAIARRDGSPKHVWMMTGVLIRMARYLGLHKDGSDLKHLSPFDIETRRRLWWGVMQLDLRASEDQATESGIPEGSFDVCTPLNLNDSDISPTMKEMPAEREGITDSTFVRIMVASCRSTRQLMYSGALSPTLSRSEKQTLLDSIYRNYEDGYLKYTTSATDVKYWFAITVSRIVTAKLTLLVFLPNLFTAGNVETTQALSDKLLVAAIELAELNHRLNEERAWQQWHWICQTYTHWHAIIYILLEACRRPWTATMERAWVALHSKWLIPKPSSSSKASQTWIPLKKLMTRARRHRREEFRRLKANPQAVVELEAQDHSTSMLSEMAVPSMKAAPRSSASSGDN